MLRLCTKSSLRGHLTHEACKAKMVCNCLRSGLKGHVGNFGLEPSWTSQINHVRFNKYIPYFSRPVAFTNSIAEIICAIFSSLKLKFNSPFKYSTLLRMSFSLYIVEFGISMVKCYITIISVFIEYLTSDAMVCDIYHVDGILSQSANDCFLKLEFIATMGTASLKEK